MKYCFVYDDVMGTVTSSVTNNIVVVGDKTEVVRSGSKQAELKDHVRTEFAGKLEAAAKIMAVPATEKVAASTPASTEGTADAATPATKSKAKKDDSPAEDE